MPLANQRADVQWPGSPGGFTLIELLIAMVASGAIGTWFGLRVLKRMQDRHFGLLFNIVLSLLAARQAIENDVHAIGVSTLAAGHKTLVPALVDALRAQGANDIVVFVGGVVPQQDYDALYQAGARGIFGPGTPIPVSAAEVLKQIRAARR